MKTNYLILLSIPLLLSSCQPDQDIDIYDSTQSYVYFAVPNPETRSSKTQLYIDSMEYSFVFEQDDVREKQLAIPIRIIGQALDMDRRFDYTIDDVKTTIDPTLIQISEPIIHANKLQDSLYINILRDQTLQGGAHIFLSLTLRASDQFQLGHEYNTRLKISISDQLLEPEWWKRWVSIFGAYKREVYRLWMDVYYLGADPTVPFSGEGGEENTYYWKNMPYAPSSSWYPVTYMYIDKLRKYLETNAVYPNGDTTKPRIYLP